MRWVIAFLLGLPAGLGVVYRKPIHLQGQIRYYEWQCRHTMLSRDQLVYSNVPEDVIRLKSDPRYVVIPGNPARKREDVVLLRPQHCWQEWNRLTLNNSLSRPAVMFQPMTTPGGRRVTTAIAWSPDTQHGLVYGRSSLLALPNRLHATCLGATYGLVHHAPGQLRVYAGTVDENNASQLVVPVEIAGKRTQLVGQLRDDGFIIIPAVAENAR